jgi:hypothetical protein
MNSIDLLQVAKALDPRFVENMPQEVANAFANGDVARIFRTSRKGFCTGRKISWGSKGQHTW